MKKICILFCLLAGLGAYAQEKLYVQVVQRLKAENPDLRTENKLIVINVWSPADTESRTRNQDLQKSMTAFGVAKLKGGARGMISVLICPDADLSMQTIALEKDDINGPHTLSGTGLETAGLKTIIFDSKGNLISKNFDLSFFEAVHQLITR